MSKRRAVFRVEKSVRCGSLVELSFTIRIDPSHTPAFVVEELIEQFLDDIEIFEFYTQENQPQWTREDIDSLDAMIHSANQIGFNPIDRDSVPGG